MRLKIALLALALCGLSAVPPAPASKAEAQGIQPAWVDPRNEQRNRGHGHEDSRPVRPVREVIESVRQRYGGGPMGGPRLEQSGGRSFYVLNWRFPNEVVEEIRVDAESGQIYR